MKKQLSILSLLLVFTIAASAQSGKIKWKQIASGTEGQIAIVGTDGNGAWVTPVFTKWADTLTYIATKQDVKKVENKEVTTGAFDANTGNTTLTKKDGSVVVYSIDGRFVPLTQKAAANGVATLGVDGKVPSSQLPAQRISEVFVVGSQAAMLAASAVKGDFAVRTDENKTYILQATPASTLANWIELPQVDGVTSVNGKAGTVTLNTDDVSEGAINKYFSNLLARAALSGSGDIQYNSGTGVVSHATSGVAAGTYNNVTVNANGHVTGGSNAAYVLSSALNDYYTKTQLQTGGQANVHWNNISGKPSNLGATEAKQSFASGTSQFLNLSNVPLFPAAILVYLNGVLLRDEDYSISSGTITLGFTREASDVITVKYSY